MKILKLLLFAFILLFLKEASAAHFIVGSINDSFDGTSPNGRNILIWQASNLSNNISDTIGTNGNSFTSNFYMVDCELFTTACNIGDILSVKVFDNGDGYHTEIVNVTVTGAGFDLVNSLLLNSPPKTRYIIVDDDISSPQGEIDLLAGNVRSVNCAAEFYDSENDSVSFLSSAFFDFSSFYSDSDDGNYHYTNSTCSNFFNVTSNTTLINCSYSLNYYANNNNWNCTINLSDYSGSQRFYSNTTFVNKLLSFSLPNEIDYGTTDTNAVSDEIVFNVTNVGNSVLNLSLYGYGVTPNDNLSMNCSLGSNISIYYQKYNLTASNPGAMTLSQFTSRYRNLTSSPVTNRFNLMSRQNDAVNEAVNSTYWRIYVPSGSAGGCSGVIVFGATQAP